MIANPFSTFTGLDGQPLNAGFIYIGTENLNPETSPVTVYWDLEQTQPAAQPIRTVDGYPSRNGSPGQIFGPAKVSMTVKDKNGVFIFTIQSVTTGIDYGTY